MPGRSGAVGAVEVQALDALAAGSPPPISGQMAFHNLAIIEAARMATDARRAIDLTEL